MLPDDTTSSIWEYTIVHTDRLNTPAGPQLSVMWRRKYADGTTDWDHINRLGEEGWEMISAFPVEAGGTLQYVAFVFKRLKRASSPPALPAPDEASASPADAPAAPAETPPEEPPAE